jgi:DNA mismatch repair protein MutS2
LKLVDVPGVGPKIRERLMQHYGCEENALEAILKGDVCDLISVFSERQAVSLSRWARGVRFGVPSDDFLATDEASRIYEEILSAISIHAHTDYARLKLRTIFPTSSWQLIKENRAMAEYALSAARRLEGSGIEDSLRGLKPLRDKPVARIRDRAVAVTDVQALMQLKSRGLDRMIDLHLTESPGDLKDLVEGYSHVSLVGEMDGPAVEEAQSLDEWYLVPESILDYYRENLETISSSIRAAGLLQHAKIRSFEGLDDLKGMIDLILQSDDSELDLLKKQLSGLKGCVKDAAFYANSELKRRIESSSVTLAGGDVLQVLSRGEGAREIFELRLQGIFEIILKEAKARAASKLGLEAPLEARLDDIFPSEVQYPLELDTRALLDLEQDLRCRIESRGLKSRRDLARRLADKKEIVKKLVADIMEFDFIYAIGRFALSKEMILPEMVDLPCLGFEEGRNLFLSNPEPVSYSLGETGLVAHTERVVVLSGVNSGGKTSLLDLISQIAILAHMGLPVPTKLCRCGLFQELYYFSKSRGTLSAGAFETAMRKFAVVENSKRKLVMADELESITEPGASARIIACMLDELSRLGSAAVFVSHLAENVSRAAKMPVRVDGIEAEGLDEMNNLIVRRTPRYNHLARSTPELILDRLARTAKGPEQEFYSRLLAKFR